MQNNAGHQKKNNIQTWHIPFNVQRYRKITRQRRNQFTRYKLGDKVAAALVERFTVYFVLWVCRRLPSISRVGFRLLKRNGPTTPGKCLSRNNKEKSITSGVEKYFWFSCKILWQKGFFLHRKVRPLSWLCQFLSPRLLEFRIDNEMTFLLVQCCLEEFAASKQPLAIERNQQNCQLNINSDPCPRLPSFLS